VAVPSQTNTRTRLELRLMRKRSQGVGQYGRSGDFALNGGKPRNGEKRGTYTREEAQRG